MKQIHQAAKKRRGFTLIELMIVMAVLSVLAVSGLASFQASQRNARDGRRKADLETIRQALELYRRENGRYPISNPAVAGGWQYSSDAQPWINDNGAPGAGFTQIPLVPTYIRVLPVDPQNKTINSVAFSYAFHSAGFGSATAGQEYVLMDHLESGEHQTTTYGGIDYQAWRDDPSRYWDGNPSNPSAYHPWWMLGEP